jgi:class 3 adenylate cyclase
MNVEMNETVEDSDEYAYGSKPIADLFPETTILFADLVGFTAWSSVRIQCNFVVCSY